MLAETVSLGILSLPYAVSSVGLIPGTVLIIAFGFITTYTGYEVYRFKMRFPEIKSFAEAGSLIGGTAGRWLVEIMQMGMLIFIMAGHIIIFEAMAVKLSHEGICAVWWTVLALVINICCSLPRALKTNSWFSIFCECPRSPSFGASQSFDRSTLWHSHPPIRGDRLTDPFQPASRSSPPHSRPSARSSPKRVRLIQYSTPSSSPRKVKTPSRWLPRLSPTFWSPTAATLRISTSSPRWTSGATSRELSSPRTSSQQRYMRSPASSFTPTRERMSPHLPSNQRPQAPERSRTR